MERLDGEKSLKWGILDAYTSRKGEIKDKDEYSDGEYELEQSNGLEPTVIFKILTPTSIGKLAPEQNITLFALRLALIEKLASGIGTLSFIWATTIILGGFASNINPVDFMVITLILAAEGTRIFRRSRELEWQHLASKSSRLSLAHETVRAYHNTRKKVPPPLSELPGKQPEAAGKPRYRDATVTSHDDPGSQVGQCRDGNFQPILYWPAVETCREKPARDQNLESTVRSKTEDLGEETDHCWRYHQSSWENNCSPSHNMTQKNSSSGNFPSTLLGKDTVDGTSFKSRSTDSMEQFPKFRCGYTSINLSTRGMTAVLYWVQMILVITCLVLSLWRLLSQEYTPPAVLKKKVPANLYASLNIFYTLALTEALLFLLKRVYWDYTMNSDRLMVQVTGKTELGDDNQETIKQFFYEVYKKCIDGSVFDGLAMDIVEYSLTLLQSDNSCEQLGGLRMLRRVVDRCDGFSLDALRRIGRTPGLLERLVEMLSWHGIHQHAIRQEVAALIYKGVRYSKNCFRIAAVPGSVEGIVSLLRPHESDRVEPTTLDGMMDSLTSDGSTALRLDGLRILLAYARDPVNLLKIGETLDLVPILVSLIRVTDVSAFKRMERAKLETFDKALRLLAMLATARNMSGTILRPVIVRQMSGIASLRDILEFGDCHPQLQWMAIEILTNLTLDDDIRRVIGSTGGVIRNLLTLYTRNLDRPGIVFATEENQRAEMAVSTRAGDALYLLAILNRENCIFMMDLQDGKGMRTFIPALIGLLYEDREQTICAAKILRSLLEYGSYAQKREIAVCIVRVLRLLMGSPSQKMHEAVVGLSSRVLDVLNEPTYNLTFESMDRTELVQKLLKNLEYNAQVSSRFPRVRRHSIELIRTLVNRDPIFFEQFMKDGLLERKLVQTLDSISEAEDFVIFSGTEGLTRHSITMENLVQRSLQELHILVEGREKLAFLTVELAPI